MKMTYPCASSRRRSISVGFLFRRFRFLLHEKVARGRSRSSCRFLRHFEADVVVEEVVADPEDGEVLVLRRQLVRRQVAALAKIPFV